MKLKLYILALAAALTSCNGILGGIYDSADDSHIASGFEKVGNNRYTLIIDATSYKLWHYIDLHNLTVATSPVPTELTGDWDGKSGVTYNLVEGGKYTQLSFSPADTQQDAEKWDFAIHHFDVKTNKGSATATQFTSIDELPSAAAFDNAVFTADVWSSTQAIVDFSGMMAFHIGYQNSYVNEVICDWVKMDFSTPPPVYTASGKVYVMRLADGSRAALRLKSYMSDAGTKGVLTIDILYPYE